MSVITSSNIELSVEVKPGKFVVVEPFEMSGRSFIKCEGKFIGDHQAAKMLNELSSPWIKVDKDNYPKNRVIAFSDNEDASFRHRFIPAGLFRQAAQDATHYMEIPDDPQ